MLLEPNIEHVVGLIHARCRYISEVEKTSLHQIDNPSWSTHKDIGVPAEVSLVIENRGASKHG